MTETQRRLVEALRAVLAQDDRVRSVWLSGSLGRGAGDAWSDVDLVVEVDEAERAQCLSDYRAGRPGQPEIILGHELFGRVLAAVTPSWERYDIVFVTPAELDAMDGDGLSPLIGEAARRPPSQPPRPDLGVAARHAARVMEFLRVLGLLDVAVGRREWVVGQQGAELLRRMLVELMLDENGPVVRGGAKRLNPFLTDAQRAELEAIRLPAADAEGLIMASAEHARAFLPRAKRLSGRLGVAWPEAFEAATRAHLQRSLGLSI